MAAKTITEIKAALNDDEAARKFGKGFADAYFAQPFGVMSKGEIELLVLRLLVEAGIVDPEGSPFRTSRALNITPQRARNLLFNYQLRYTDDEALDARILEILSNTRFSVDGQRLSFGIESPLVRAAIEARLNESHIFADVTVGSQVLKVPLSQFGEFITLLLPEEKAKALEKVLRDAGHLEDEGLTSWLTTFASETVKEGTKEAVKGRFSDLLEWLGDFLPGDGMPDFLSGGDLPG